MTTVPEGQVTSILKKPLAETGVLGEQTLYVMDPDTPSAVQIASARVADIAIAIKPTIKTVVINFLI